MLKNFNAGKSQLLSFDRSNDNGSIDVNMEGCVLEERPSVKMLGLTFSSKLDWGSYIKFLSPEVVLYLYKSIIRLCMEYCCHVWAGAPS